MRLISSADKRACMHAGLQNPGASGIMGWKDCLWTCSANCQSWKNIWSVCWGLAAVKGPTVTMKNNAVAPSFFLFGENLTSYRRIFLTISDFLIWQWFASIFFINNNFTILLYRFLILFEGDWSLSMALAATVIMNLIAHILASVVWITYCACHD